MLGANRSLLQSHSREGDGGVAVGSQPPLTPDGPRSPTSRPSGAFDSEAQQCFPALALRVREHKAIQSRSRGAGK